MTHDISHFVKLAFVVLNPIPQGTIESLLLDGSPATENVIIIGSVAVVLILTENLPNLPYKSFETSFP